MGRSIRIFFKASPKVVFGKRLRQLRQEKGLSQEALARAANVDRTYVSSCERGKKNVCLESIYKLSASLNVPPSKLLEPPERS
jgi:transcriptional regulator with XRE-family HTH domain